MTEKIQTSQILMIFLVIVGGAVFSRFYYKTGDLLPSILMASPFILTILIYIFVKRKEFGW